MTLENQYVDRKSLRKITGKTADWNEVAKDCVCFANGAGGRLLIGIEDGETILVRSNGFRWMSSTEPGSG